MNGENLADGIEPTTEELRDEAVERLMIASGALLGMLAVWLPTDERSADYVHVWDAAERVEQAIEALKEMGIG